ncbi:hypothetical protein V6N12_005231 [Hibiscus sabdariffa]|uniref:Uncharacterized protein n=1 Tax=Hibiscus sabdariffa TaxID=183260 RepID=A0ABR2CNU8_9ROSI
MAMRSLVELVNGGIYSASMLKLTESSLLQVIFEPCPVPVPPSPLNQNPAITILLLSPDNNRLKGWYHAPGCGNMDSKHFPRRNAVYPIADLHWNYCDSH